MPKTCDHRVSGAIVRGADHLGPSYAGPRDLVLISKRVKPPFGWSSPAGHWDGHGGAEDAMAAEVREETGLIVMDYKDLTGGWRDGRCSRTPARPERPGHNWSLYEVHAIGTLRAAPDENSDLRWVHAAELAALAQRTLRYAMSLMTDEDFRRDPGLEPVWCRWYVNAGILRLHKTELAAIEALVANPYIP